MSAYKSRMAALGAFLFAIALVGLLHYRGYQRQSVQRAVDSAAEKGVRALARGEDPRGPAARRAGQELGRDAAGRIAIEHPPAWGRYSGESHALRVVFEAPHGQVAATAALLPFPDDPRYASVVRVE